MSRRDERLEGMSPAELAALAGMESYRARTWSTVSAILAGLSLAACAAALADWPPVLVLLAAVVVALAVLGVVFVVLVAGDWLDGRRQVSAARQARARHRSRTAPPTPATTNRTASPSG